MHKVKHYILGGFLFLIICPSTLLLTAQEAVFCECVETTMISQQMTSQDQLIKLAQDYLTFVHDVGSIHSVQSNDPRIGALFAEDLTKIDNRLVLFEKSRQSLLPQMRGFEKEYDPEARKLSWTLDRDNALIVPSAETNAVVIHFEWLHTNVGRGTTTVILQCNASGKIERIIDVWALVPKS